MEFFLQIVGWMVGLAGSILVGMLGVVLAILIAEFLMEWVDRLTGFGPEYEPNEGKDLSKPVAVIVSDLHIDTWKDPTGQRTDKSPEFLAFLDQVQESGIPTFILNGDLWDAPPFQLNQMDPTPLQVNQLNGALHVSDWPVFGGIGHPGIFQDWDEPILHRLAALGASGCNLIYGAGNHDFTMSGLRFISHSKDISWSPSISFDWMDPDSVAANGKRVLRIEHGHRFDIFLWLYLRYSMMDVLRPMTSRSNNGMQRGGKTGVGAPANQNIDPRQIDPLAKSPPKVEAPKMIFRFFARLQLFYLRTLQKGARSMTDVGQALTIGHTHKPDRYRFRSGLYVNSGDWSGETPHQTYLLVLEDGSINGPYQWPYWPSTCL
ncbi:MAG: metallophosphoesterase [Armatimonadetes bacterium]|nr:metallophosphoesterase [Armatimonadota bacterium]